MNTIAYIDALKSRLNIQSDYALSKHLRVTKQAISRYQRGINHFDDDVSHRVAEILGIHPGVVMLDMYFERAKTAQDKTAWQEISNCCKSLLQKKSLTNSGSFNAA